MDFIFEFLFELILEGCIGVAEEKRVPLPVRILAAFLLVAGSGAIVGLLFYEAISNHSWILMIFAVFLAVLLLLAFMKVYKKFQKNKEK